MSRSAVAVILLALLCAAAGGEEPDRPPGDRESPVESQQSGIVWSGRVFDARTLRPVAAAEVEVSGRGLVTTDEEGRFRILAAAGPFTVRVTRVGYRPRTWEVGNTSPGFAFPLMPEMILLDGVVVSATRMPLPEAASGPVSVVALDRVPGATDPVAALRGATGVESRDYVNYSSLALRGTGAEHALVALDGIRLNSAQSGLFDLTVLPAAVARRAEIARGPGSALYGSSAVGGTVNLLTGEPERLGAGLRTGLGAFGRRYVEATHEHRVAPLGYLVGLTLDAAENDFTWTDDSGAARTMTNADRTGTAAFAKGSWREGGHRVNLFGLWSETRRGVPGPLNWPSAAARRDDRQAFGYLRHTFEPDERLWLDTRAHAGRSWQNYRDSLAFVPENDTHRLTGTGLQADAACAPARWLVLQFGAEVAQSRFDGTAIGEAERLDLAGMGQLRLAWLGIALQPAVRLERLRQDLRGDTASHRQTTDVASPKLTLSWTGLELAAPYAAFGRSFRAPSLNELYWPAGEWTRGNPQLRPEWATGIEAGLRGRHRGASWLVGWYRNSLEDLIQWQPDDSFRWRPVNVAQATMTGLEAEFALGLGRLGLDGNVNWCRARAEGERLRYRPELSARGRAWLEVGDVLRLFSTGTAFPDLRLSLGADWSGDRLADPAFPDTVPERMPPLAFLDAGLEAGYPVGPARIALSAGVRNLTDTRGETMRHYPMPGRNWYAELKLATGRSGSQDRPTGPAALSDGVSSGGGRHARSISALSRSRRASNSAR